MSKKRAKKMPRMRCKMDGCNKEWESVQEWEKDKCTCTIEAMNKIIETKDEVISHYDQTKPALFVEVPEVLCSHIMPHNKKVRDEK